jgi:hypothetical protein
MYGGPELNRSGDVVIIELLVIVELQQVLAGDCEFARLSPSVPIPFSLVAVFQYSLFVFEASHLRLPAVCTYEMASEPS